MAEQHPKPKKSAVGTLLVWQSAVCGVVLLVALIVRLIGGSFYEQLRTTFRNALTDNGIADAVSSWLENGDA